MIDRSQDLPTYRLGSVFAGREWREVQRAQLMQEMCPDWDDSRETGGVAGPGGLSVVCFIS